MDLSSLHIVPAGADEPLPLATEQDAEITAADVRRAIRKWDEMFPQYAGLLEAKNIGEPNTPA